MDEDQEIDQGSNIHDNYPDDDLKYRDRRPARLSRLCTRTQLSYLRFPRKKYLIRNKESVTSNK